LRFTLSDEVQDGWPFAFLVPAAARINIHRTGIPKALAALVNRHVPSKSAGIARPTRLALFHSRALQALDGKLSGATHREIAIALFGANRVQRGWHPGGDLRSQTSYLIKRATALMNADYRFLLASAAPKLPR